jgi:hypothetical protein
MAPSSSTEARRLVILKLLREGRLGPGATAAPPPPDTSRETADPRSGARSG